MGGRQAASFLTRATWIGGGAYLVLALLLAVASARQSAPPESILREEFGQPVAPPASVLETEGQAAPANPVPVQTPPDGESGAGEEPDGE
jgi:preprotein translocase subunit SecG